MRIPISLFVVIVAILSGCKTTTETATRIDSKLPASAIVFPVISPEYDTPPVFLSGRAPKFPYAAWKTGKAPRKGFATIEFTITEEGTIGDIKVIDKTHPQYAAAVIYNLRNWKFKPATKNGKPVPHRLRYTWILELKIQLV